MLPHNKVLISIESIANMLLCKENSYIGVKSATIWQGGYTMFQNSSQGRRGFFKKSTAALGATAMTTGLVSSLNAASINAAPSPLEPMKIGVFGIDYTFWGLWADLLSPTGQWSGTSLLRMRPSHIWDKDRKKAQEFADKWGCEVVDKYDGMVGKVDGVVNGELYNIPWQHQLMRPYIEAGIPCYLQRPWSNTIRNLDEMLDLAAKHNTPIIATATFEHNSEADNFSKLLVNVGEIQAAFGTSRVGDRPHFHLPYMMMKILGYDVETVNMIADDPKKIGYMNINYVYSKTDKHPAFVLSMHAAKPDVYSFAIYGDKGTESARMPAGTDYYHRFIDQLVDIQKTFEKREHYQPLDIIRKKFLCVQAEYYSHYERGGAPVRIGTVPADWPIPAWRPDWYDGSEFKG